MYQASFSDSQSAEVEAILELLRAHRQGRPARAIARDCGLSLRRISPILNGLKRDGLLKERAGRWLLSDAEPARRKVPKAANAVQTPEGLELLRKICSFHADAVYEVAASKLSLAVDSAELRSELCAPVDWFQLATEGMAVSRDLLPAGEWGRQGGRTVFCGPIHRVVRKVRGGEETCWLPIFLVHATSQRHADRIEFRLEGNVQVNMDWLAYRFSAADEDLRDDFLIRIGLLREDQSGSLKPLEIRNFEACWEALRKNVTEIEWVGQRNLRSPVSPLDFARVRENGIYSHVLAFKEELPSFTKGLIHDLRTIARAKDSELASCGLTALLKVTTTSGSSQPDEEVTLAEASPLNPSQQDAVIRSLKEPLIVIQGPPGTGKSTVVRSTLLSIGVNGQAALFASKNHRAVDEVVERINPDKEGCPLVADLRPSDSGSRWTAQLLKALGQVEQNGEEILTKFRDSLSENQKLSSEILSAISASMQLADQLSEVSDHIIAWKASHPELDHLAEKLQFPVPASDILKMRQAQELSVLHPARWVGLLRTWHLLRALRLQASSEDVLTSEAIAHVAMLRVVELRGETLETEIRERPGQHQDAQRLDDLLQERQALVMEHLHKLPLAWAGRVRTEITALNQLRVAQPGRSRTVTSRARQVALDHFPKLLPGLPLWAITNLSANRAVPLKAGVFDLAVIDEAGQCDPASVLPLLFRAKRGMFVGDPQQLRPIGSLSIQKEDLLRRKYGMEGPEFGRFGFTGRSAYDLAQDALVIRGGKVGLLREHYRCHPQIAEFFNREFYEGNLLVRTTGRRGVHRNGGIKWTHVPGGSETVNASRWHRIQVDAILKELTSLADRDFDGSVGVVTPFREHAKRVRDAAHQVIGSRQIKKWNFLADTADGFQGGERDLVLFGLVGGGGGERPTPAFYLRDQNRFNVAVSRARHVLHVFGDLEWAKSCEVPVLNHLAEASQSNWGEATSSVRKDLIGPVWEPRLAEEMERAGLEYFQQYPACGHYLDFALFPPDGKRINVEVDGETYHRDRDGNLRPEDVRRDLVLRADGWTVKRFWVYELREDMDSCIRQIKTLVG
jgi:very-short-patch-repair endonuclease